MRTAVEPLEGNKVKLSVEVDEQEFEKAVDAAFRKFAREVRIPGFRPGKAPRRLLEARIGLEAARQEALRDALPDYYSQALRDADVDAIAPPEIDITGGEERGAVTFDAVVEVRPQVSVAGYGGLRVVIPSPDVTDDDVDHQVDRLRNQFAELNSVERAAHDGDYISIDLSAERAGEAVPGMSADDYLYEVGSGTVLPELDDHVRGAKVGDILQFTANPDGAEPLEFRVLVKDVKEKVLPDVTDEWASEASEFETLEELRDDIRTRVAAVKRVQAQLAMRDEALKALVELVEDDAPEPLVGAELERRVHDLGHRLEAQGISLEMYLQATQTSGEQLLAELRETAVSDVKADLALRALAEAEGIEPGDDDMDRQIEVLAQQVGQKPADVRRQLERADQMPTVRSDVKKAKALEWLLEHIEVVDEEGQPIDREALAPRAEVAPEASAESSPEPQEEGDTEP